LHIRLNVIDIRHEIIRADVSFTGIFPSCPQQAQHRIFGLQEIVVFLIAILNAVLFIIHDIVYELICAVFLYAPYVGAHFYAMRGGIEHLPVAGKIIAFPASADAFICTAISLEAAAPLL
jgi:hypothetical protein